MLESLMTEMWAVFLKGGVLMVPLFMLSVFIFQTALKILFSIKHNAMLKFGVHRMQDHEIDLLVENPAINTRLPLFSGGKDTTHILGLFAEVRHNILSPLNRRIAFLAAIIAAAPLLGLLGTVMGMLKTFNGLLHAADKFDSMAGGISEALITTQTGLVISIPAMIILSQIKEQKSSLHAALTKLEGYHLRQRLKMERSTRPVRVSIASPSESAALRE